MGSSRSSRRATTSGRSTRTSPGFPCWSGSDTRSCGPSTPIRSALRWSPLRHEPLQEEDYALLRRVPAETRPRALTLEYAGDEASLLEQIVRLRDTLWRAAPSRNTGAGGDAR